MNLRELLTKLLLFSHKKKLFIGGYRKTDSTDSTSDSTNSTDSTTDYTDSTDSTVHRVITRVIRVHSTTFKMSLILRENSNNGIKQYSQID